MSQDKDAIIQKLADENTKLRIIVAKSNIDCLYCGLPKVDMVKCPSGFPGCGRADDIMLADDEPPDAN